MNKKKHKHIKNQKQNINDAKVSKLQMSPGAAASVVTVASSNHFFVTSGRLLFETNLFGVPVC
jgi:hypothetical protein